MSSTSTTPTSYEAYVASRTIPDTFEEYVARFMGGDAEARQRLLDEHGDEVREMFDREHLGAQTHPAPGEMPPCPSWCVFPAGHVYETLDDLDLAAGLVTLSRFHVSPGHNIEDAPYLSQEEDLRGGKVTLHDVVISVRSGNYGIDEIDAPEARRRASELLEAADLLERIERA